ncbi:hypothetical protein [Shewanella kaireitica]|uniref:hypothetical protein n=1 Tax=Shewanella kaireitica TaxID=212021 RepID=UPI00200BE452|nr:hypothetical protein [Shewanella kaireitica]MCL1092281.1 hypothetical protein [Shewanella kaireitica]
MKFFRIFVCILPLINSLPSLAESRSHLIVSSTESDLSLRVLQENNKLTFSCDSASHNIKTTLTTNIPYAYYADDSLLIVGLNGIICQMSGRSSASTFVSNESCELEKDRKLRHEFQSNKPLSLELEAISMSSGRSSSAKFNIDAEAIELRYFFNQCKIID